MRNGAAFAVAATLAAVLVSTGVGGGGPLSDSPPTTAPNAPSGTVAARAGANPPMLVLFDSSGEFATVAQVDSILSANLMGHFGPVTRLPIQEYTPGLMARFGGVVYEGSSFDEPLPAAFLDDVAAGRTPVVWAGMNIWQLDDRVPGGLADAYGFSTGPIDSRPVTRVTYAGMDLDRRSGDGTAGLVPITVTDPTRATALATGVGDDGHETVWAVDAGRLTYVSESPYPFMTERDRYLAWADILIGAFAPETPTRHRALVRLEDIGPSSNPKLLRASIDVLVERDIPFTMGVYPLFMDPQGVQGKPYGSGSTPGLELGQRPELVEVITYGLAHGGEIVSHGYTHQYGEVANPYNALSGNDFEFFEVAVTPPSGDVDLLGPVDEDSKRWATERMTSARDLLDEAGIPLSKVNMFEFPHYAASVDAQRAFIDVYRGLNGDNPPTRYERSIYFPDTEAGDPDYTRPTGQFFPYPVVDVYGALVVPENLGNVIEVSGNNNAVRSAAEIVENARRNLVVRDGFASFFYHPYLGPEMLAETVDGIIDLGYEFVPATSIRVD